MYSMFALPVSLNPFIYCVCNSVVGVKFIHLLSDYHIKHDRKGARTVFLLQIKQASAW